MVTTVVYSFYENADYKQAGNSPIRCPFNTSKLVRGGLFWFPTKLGVLKNSNLSNFYVFDPNLPIKRLSCDKIDTNYYFWNFAIATVVANKNTNSEDGNGCNHLQGVSDTHGDWNVKLIWILTHVLQKC